MVDFSDTPEQAAFRAEVEQFVEEKLPQAMRDEAQYAGVGIGGMHVGPLSEEERERLLTEWQSALVERGWRVPEWPQEYGGAGMSVMQQFVLNEVFAEKRAPRVGAPNVGSTIIVHGSDEQKREHLPPMLRGEVRWCQGYSEPGAGSDLASVQTRAIRDGDEFVLNGQKIWTSGAAKSDWMFGLFRSDPDAPKHRGITYLLLPMDSPGITVRPLAQINGASDFNEVFFEDVRVPVKNAVGEVNRGWYVGATHLDFERSSIGGAVGILNTFDDLWGFLEEEADRGEGGRTRLDDLPILRQHLAECYVEANVALLFSYRVVSMQNRGEIPNYEASVSKVFTTESTQRTARAAVKTLGLYGNLAGKEDPLAPMRSKWSSLYVSSVSGTIGGGTSEIQRNIIATRGLGLPRG